MSEQWTSEVSADQPAERWQGVDVVEQADVTVDSADAVAEGDAADSDAAETDDAVADVAETDDAVADVDIADGEDEVEDEAAFRARLRIQEGDWFVIHSYAGYENRVKANLQTRVTSLNMEPYIFDVQVPM